MTHSVSGVAECLSGRLVDCHIQHSGAVTRQSSDGTGGHKPGPQPDCPVATSGDHQLEGGAVVETFNSLKKQTPTSRGMLQKLTLNKVNFNVMLPDS